MPACALSVPWTDGTRAERLRAAAVRAAVAQRRIPVRNFNQGMCPMVFCFENKRHDPDP
jgi:hypothetical protein